MIKSLMKTQKGNQLLVLGLSDINMERLKKGEPIRFNLSELGLGDIDVVIFNGRNEQEMYKMFKDRIDPLKTVLKDSNSDKN